MVNAVVVDDGVARAAAVGHDEVGGADRGPLEQSDQFVHSERCNHANEHAGPGECLQGCHSMGQDIETAAPEDDRLETPVEPKR
jgi:hypothetical protein